MNDLTSKEKKIVADAITDTTYYSEIEANDAAVVLTKITGRKYVVVTYDNTHSYYPHLYYVEVELFNQRQAEAYLANRPCERLSNS